MGKKYNNKYLSALFVPGRALMTFMCYMSRPRGNKQLHLDFLFLFFKVSISPFISQTLISILLF